MCPRCDILNANNSKFCSKCGGILDMETAMQFEDEMRKQIDARRQSDDVMASLMGDPEVQRFLLEKMSQLKIARV